MRTSSTETQRCIYDSDEEERRRREAELWSDGDESPCQCGYQPPSPSPSPPLPPPPPREEEEEEEVICEDDVDDIIDAIVQTAVDASMEFAKRLFRSAPLVSAPVPPYVASYPQCQCYDMTPPPSLPFQAMPPQQIVAPPPPPPPQSVPMPAAATQEYQPPPPYHYNDVQQQQTAAPPPPPPPPPPHRASQCLLLPRNIISLHITTACNNNRYRVSTARTYVWGTGPCVTWDWTGRMDTTE